MIIYQSIDLINAINHIGLQTAEIVMLKAIKTEVKCTKPANKIQIILILMNARTNYKIYQ